MAFFEPDLTFTGTNTASNATLTLTTADTIPVGSFVVIGTVRATNTGNTNGVSSISDPAGNTWTVNNAVANRAISNDISLHSCYVTSQIASGSTITVTFNSTGGARKAAVGGVWSGMTNGTVNAHSGNTYAGTGEVASNANGSGTSQSVSTSATTVADTLVCYAFSGNSGNPATPGAGLTAVATISTAAGSSERGITLAFATETTTGVKTGTATQPTNGGWAAAAAAYEMYSDEDPVRSGRPKVWNGTAWQAYTARVWDGSDWVSYQAKGYNGSEWIASK